MCPQPHAECESVADECPLLCHSLAVSDALLREDAATNSPPSRFILLVCRVSSLEHRRTADSDTPLLNQIRHSSQPLCLVPQPLYRLFATASCTDSRWHSCAEVGGSGSNYGLNDSSFGRNFSMDVLHSALTLLLTVTTIPSCCRLQNSGCHGPSHEFLHTSAFSGTTTKSRKTTSWTLPFIKSASTGRTKVDGRRGIRLPWFMRAAPELYLPSSEPRLVFRRFVASNGIRRNTMSCPLFRYISGYP